MEPVLIAIVPMVFAVTAMFWLMPRIRPSRIAGTLTLSRLRSDPVWIFDGPELLDMSAEAKDLIKADRADLDWTLLHDRLHLRFPGFPRTQVEVRAKRRVVLQSADIGDPGTLECEWLDGLIRTRILRRRTLESDEIDGESNELSVLRRSMKEAPYPIWCLAEDGQVTWFNTSYEKLCKDTRPRSGEPQNTPFALSDLDIAPGKTKRVSVDHPSSGKQFWFNVSRVPVEGGHLYYAVDINAVVDAEVAQRNFVQTLAKTFAQLSIGLAIFDRNRQLVLFNPALIDLTALPADFLSARPNLLSFFDRMRDQRMMPEPKNYGSWRHQIADLVAAAVDGRYQETWSLPSGSVYSVSGRPHPDGAIAFLFEDITAEITLTRRFRSDLEMGQSILDQLDSAIAVFSSDGTLTMSNSAYHRLWSVDPDRTFAQTSVLDATRIWQGQCEATPIWSDIRDFVANRENRAEWWADIVTNSGQQLICGVHPIQNGATMVGFSAGAPARSARKLSHQKATQPG